MAGDINIKYGPSNQAITCGFQGLTNNSARQSTAIDNSSNTFVDALVMIKVTSGGSGTAATGYINVYAYGSVNGGTNYSDSASGSDGSITLTAPPNMRIIGIINVVANSTTYWGGPFSVAAAFNGILPQYWGIVIENKTGGTLDADDADNDAIYQGIEAQYS